ncbi:tryptophan synthase beta chain [Thermotomaculum hydrothermale]|uniref:Tryptophan synthase beta chain n=2 Tax=Thermotomaculum hydrothermale TaxID=981385 RepID=A0A7R6PDL6_9BACT|nr:tryptophan synthase beta chain [Thermotomaculum hydrothermale]
MEDFMNTATHIQEKKENLREGFFGKFGGAYVPEVLKPILDELAEAYKTIVPTKEFQEEFRYYLKHYAGRPSPLYFAERLTEYCGGAKIYLKREDLNHTGAHKINHTIGEALLAKKMGKKKLIAETGAGQHGVATATVAARFGFDCDIYMGAVDVKKQAPNVLRMKLLGANVIEVNEGAATLKEAVDAALNAFVQNHEDVFYALGSAVGPHPYPSMVRDFQKIVGEEAEKQILEHEGRLPDYLIACVGGGSNAIGLFNQFLDYKEVNIIGVEPLGKGEKLGEHAATLNFGEEGIMHGFNSIMLKDEKGNPAPVYSIASGLDYPSVGPQHAFLKETGRAKYVAVTDREAIDALRILSEVEGIIPALESSHAIAYTIKFAKTLPKDKIIIVNLSGRGDKDLDTIFEILNLQV